MDNIEIVCRQVDGIAPWICTKEDIPATWNIIVREWEEGIRDNILSICKKRRTVIQAGGHQGLYPRLLAEHFTRVYTFEPHPINFYCLYMNCYAKGNIIPMQAALGEKPDLVSNMFSTMNLGMNIVINDKEFKEKVNDDKKMESVLVIPQLTLDSFKFKNVDLLYLDAEGAELSILKGAKKTIKEHNPIIIIENAVDEKKEFLDTLGYSLINTFAMDSFFIKK